MRAKSTRIILLTDFPEVENPGGIIEPGASAIFRGAKSERTMLWNMQKDSEVPGTIEINRSILWDVQEESGPELVNYVEFPFLHDARWRADPVDTQYPYLCQFRGVVRLWQSGTLQFIGEGIAGPHALATPTITEMSMKVWSGDGMDAGNIHTVFTVPLDSTWYPVSWSEKAAPGDHWEMYYGAYPEDSALGTYTARFEMLQYPTGIVFPMSFWGGSSSPIPGFTGTDMLRNGNSIDGAYAVVGSAFTTGHAIYSWHMDSTDWSLSNQVTHLLQSTLFPSSFNGTFTREIPDSATVGLRFQLYVSRAAQVDVQVDFGPVFRAAYAPTIQQGIDPIP